MFPSWFNASVVATASRAEVLNKIGDGNTNMVVAGDLDVVPLQGVPPVTDNCRRLPGLRSQAQLLGLMRDTMKKQVN